MDTNEAVEATRFWALQTIIFAMSSDNPNGPVEVLEQIKIRAHNLADRLLAESVAACGKDVSPARLIPALTTRVLDWVAESRRGK